MELVQSDVLRFSMVPNNPNSKKEEKGGERKRVGGGGEGLRPRPPESGYF